MLEKYQLFFETIDKNLENNQISHAYLLEIPEKEDRLDVALTMAKKILTYNNEDKKNIINQINNNSYYDLKIIKADGQFIKKDQIIEIQQIFKTKSISGNKRIYIIENASKLNKSSANTLLKFLEEPSENVIAILLTQNKYSVIKTIVSRCINITLSTREKQNLDLQDAINFVNLIEKYKEKTIVYLDHDMIELFESKDKLIDIFEKSMMIYSDLIYISLNIDAKFFYINIETIRGLNINNDYITNINRIKALNKCIEIARYNVNYKIIMDKFISEMFGVD